MMNADEFERRLRALAKRDGLTFATFATLPADDRTVLLTTIVLRFDPGTTYTERGVNELLKEWLAGAGAMVETDHVHVRRWLVDLQVLTRTSDCAEYRLHPDAQRRTDIVREPDVARLDPDAIVTAARREQREAREQRKTAWLKRTAGAGDAKR
jgi:hypothetical protein